MVTIVLARGLEGAIDGAIPLADGAKLIEFGGEDPATRAAAAALRLAQENPKASFAIATGRITDSHAGAYGPIIDRVATLAPRTNGIPIDEVSAALLGDRFEIERRRARRDVARGGSGRARCSASPRRTWGATKSSRCSRRRFASASASRSRAASS